MQSDRTSFVTVHRLPFPSLLCGLCALCGERLPTFIPALLCGLLLLPALATSEPWAQGTGVPPQGSPPLIEVRHDRLTVKLDGAPWTVVLAELQRQSGLTFRLQGRLAGTAVGAFEALPLEKGLRRLFRHADLIFLYAKGKEGRGTGNRLVQVWILPKAAEAPTETAETASPSPPRTDDPLGSLIQSALGADQGEARGKAVEALAQYKDPRIRETLTQALQDPDARVRESAVDALGELKDEATVDQLSRALLEDASEEVRASAADALGEIASRRAIEALSRALEDPAADVRESAVDALGRIGGVQATEALQRALRDEEEEVRKTAAEALRRMSGKTRRD